MTVEFGGHLQRRHLTERGLLAGESIGLIDYAGMALILSGVYLVGK